jgi:flagellar basal-body rod modification protein FlgD
MSTTPVSSNPTTIPGASTTPPVRTPKHTLDANDFMKLLSVQMQYQDPMKPMDNNEHMAQVAQMGSMQSITQMALGVSQMNVGQSLLLANSYLGRQVSLLDDFGNTITGQVTAIDGQDGAPKVMVGGEYYPVTAINRVEIAGAGIPATPAA